MSAPVDKLQDIIDKIDAFKKDVERIQNKYVKKINTYLDELEYTINNASTRSSAYIQMKIKKLTKKIQDTLDALMKTLKQKVESFKTWAQNAFDNISATTVMSIMGKVGVELSKEQALQMTDLIPLKLPSMDSLIPEIKLELQLPDISNLINIGEIKLPRI